MRRRESVDNRQLTDRDVDAVESRQFELLLRSSDQSFLRDGHFSVLNHSNEAKGDVKLVHIHGGNRSGERPDLLEEAFIDSRSLEEGHCG